LPGVDFILPKLLNLDKYLERKAPSKSSKIPALSLPDLDKYLKCARSRNDFVSFSKFKHKRLRPKVRISMTNVDYLTCIGLSQLITKRVYIHLELE